MKKCVFVCAVLTMCRAVNAADAPVEVMDEVEISSDTNIVVEAGKTLKFEYVYGENAVTVTKSGAGRLEIATSSHTNLSVNIAEGTFASARPAAIPLTDEFRPTLRIDANRPDTFTVANSGGTNFISKITDADGNTERWLTSWGGQYKKPYVADETFNGMGLVDFGTYYHRDVERFAGGHGGNLALNKIDGKDGFVLREFFCVWKDRDDIFDTPMLDGVAFRGPSVFGNNGNFFLRGNGGSGNGFGIMSSGMHDTYKHSFYVDGVKVPYTFKVPRGFHLMRNRADESYKEATYWTMTGWNHPQGGGFLLAEIVAYSNVLTEANALRVEAQLQSKWLGVKLNNVCVQDDATLDVGAFKFNIKTLDLAGDVNISGYTNLCFGVLTRGSSNVVASAEFRINGDAQPLVPDLAFEGGATLSVAGTSRVQTVSSSMDRLVKTGAGKLLIADPAVSDITVSAGTLDVSPLYVRSAEYHLDSTREDTIDWELTDGKKLISAWHDMEDPSRMFKATSYRRPGYDNTRLVRPPYVTENAIGDKTMVDFGTFANFNYPDGWGGCLDASHTIVRDDGAHDFFAVWQDYPEVKNYAYGGNGKPFIGPCIFGMQYHWSRGNGGNGESFPVHASGCPMNMWSPPESGLVYVDGAMVHGQDDRIGDGVHVLAQRTHTNDGHPGAPLEQIGGSYQAQSYNSEGVRTNGTYGGLLIGEVLVFRKYLTDRLRMRISGALCSKWRGDTNLWEYGALKVESGATLKHPYADLVPETLELAGTVSAVSVIPRSLEITGPDAVIDGELRLTEGGSVVVSGDPENGFRSVKAASVHAGGKGTLILNFDNPSAYVGEEYRIVESDNVVKAADFRWKAPALQGTGTRAVLKAKSDGVYLAFEGSGMTVTVR